MLRKLLFLVSGLSMLITGSVKSSSISTNWSYGTGSNIDRTITIQTDLYKNNHIIFSSRIGGGSGGLLSERIINKKHYWAGGGGISTNGIIVPDYATIEMISFHDRKRYRIKTNLPKSLEQQMKMAYNVNGQYEYRNKLYFGLAPGGYYEVVLMGHSLGVNPDILLSRGVAEEVTDDWYDKKVPVAEQYGIDSFDKKYGKLFKQHPIPLGMQWAPIMDAYRATQPRTDQQPMK
ncbi:MAG: DUF2931 family protein [Plesiomonas sp.]|uniref:DUF2931 family protein n=1 Tax=Plesiomonas sp. TaxID=2486279 RepID=UPI003F33B0A1